MKYYLAGFIIVIGLIVSVSPVIADGEPPVNEAEKVLTGESDGPSGASANFTGNPWGCKGKSHYPHESTKKPGRGWIQAKSDIECTIAPPAGSEMRILQQLYRSSYYGWVQVAVKYSQCPIGGVA